MRGGWSEILAVTVLSFNLILPLPPPREYYQDRYSETGPLSST